MKKQHKEPTSTYFSPSTIITCCHSYFIPSLFIPQSLRLNPGTTHRRGRHSSPLQPTPALCRLFLFEFSIRTGLFFFFCLFIFAGVFLKTILGITLVNLTKNIFCMIIISHLAHLMEQKLCWNFAWVSKVLLVVVWLLLFLV